MNSIEAKVYWASAAAGVLLAVYGAGEKLMNQGNESSYIYGALLKAQNDSGYPGDENVSTARSNLDRIKFDLNVPDPCAVVVKDVYPHAAANCKTLDEAVQHEEAYRTLIEERGITAKLNEFRAWQDEGRKKIGLGTGCSTNYGTGRC